MVCGIATLPVVAALFLKRILPSLCPKRILEVDASKLHFQEWFCQTLYNSNHQRQKEGKSQKGKHHYQEVLT